MFPPQPNDLLEFPVFRASSLAYRDALATRLYSFSNQLGTLGTSGTELKGKELRTADTWNRRGTLGTNFGDGRLQIETRKEGTLFIDDWTRGAWVAVEYSPEFRAKALERLKSCDKVKSRYDSQP